MENTVGIQAWTGKTAQGLEGVHGRLRIPDTSGPADATAVCASEAVVRQLLRGDLNPFIASMRRLARLKGDRGFGTRVLLGLQVGSPFSELSDAETGEKRPKQGV